MNGQKPGDLSPLERICTLLFAALALLVLGYMLFSVHPEAGKAAAPARLNMIAELEGRANNLASDALKELTYIPKIYTIPESAVVPPAPDPAQFGSTEDPAEILTLIGSAQRLLDGQSVVFDPEAEFQRGQPIRYYCDDTILVIAWREIVDGKCCTFAEVKVQDGSQLRRKLAGDSYDSGKYFYATDMANDANAVIAINGDFYAHRKVGITVYQRKVYRCAQDMLDTCFFTAGGDMLFSHAGEITEEEDAQRFVDENDVVFSASFGPILLEDGELFTFRTYPVGEINNVYSRTAIGQMDTLHYLLMTVNYSEYYQACTLREAGQILQSKGCRTAYTLDGGQTSTIVMQGETVNDVDWGTQRTMSDIIYFATALPEQGGTE